MKFRKETIVAQGAVRKAGKVLMEFYESKKLKISRKEDKTIVTEADHAAEKAIIEALSKKFPDYSVLSEESGEDTKQSDYRWIIDPLDATRNFSCSNPNFCTMVALQFKSEIISSAILLPYTKDIYVAEKGNGSFLNGRRIHVSDRSSLERFLFEECGVGHLGEPKASQTLIKIYSVFRKNMRMSGCAGLVGCLIAAGRLDGGIMFELDLHDTAPPYLLVKEAGGVVTEVGGKPWKIDSNTFLASNGKIHNKLIEILK